MANYHEHACNVNGNINTKDVSNALNQMDEYMNYFRKKTAFISMECINGNECKKNSTKPYVSCMRFGNEPILPPVLTEERRKEMYSYKEQAILLEKRLNKRHSTDSGVISTNKDDSSHVTPDSDIKEEFVKHEKTHDFIKNNSIALPHIGENYENESSCNTNLENENVRSRRNSYTLDSPSAVLIAYVESLKNPSIFSPKGKEGEESPGCVENHENNGQVINNCKVDIAYKEDTQLTDVMNFDNDNVFSMKYDKISNRPYSGNSICGQTDSGINDCVINSNSEFTYSEKGTVDNSITFDNERISVLNDLDQSLQDNGLWSPNKNNDNNSSSNGDYNHLGKNNGNLESDTLISQSCNSVEDISVYSMDNCNASNHVNDVSSISKYPFNSSQWDSKPKDEDRCTSLRDNSLIPPDECSDEDEFGWLFAESLKYANMSHDNFNELDLNKHTEKIFVALEKGAYPVCYGKLQIKHANELAQILEKHRKEQIYFHNFFQYLFKLHEQHLMSNYSMENSIISESGKLTSKNDTNYLMSNYSMENSIISESGKRTSKNQTNNMNGNLSHSFDESLIYNEKMENLVLFNENELTNSINNLQIISNYNLPNFQQIIRPDSIIRKSDFARTSTKRTIPHITYDINSKEYKASIIITAAVRGYLTRRLFKTSLVTEKVQTIKDCLTTALSLHDEENLSLSEIDLQNRLLQQLTLALSELRDIFSLPPKERAAIIASDREKKRYSTLRKLEARTRLSKATLQSIKRKTRDVQYNTNNKNDINRTKCVRRICRQL